MHQESTIERIEESIYVNQRKKRAWHDIVTRTTPSKNIPDGKKNDKIYPNKALPSQPAYTNQRLKVSIPSANMEMDQSAELSKELMEWIILTDTIEEADILKQQKSNEKI